MTEWPDGSEHTLDTDVAGPTDSSTLDVYGPVESIPFIDPVQANELKESGYSTIGDLRTADQSELSEMKNIGNAMAARIKAEVNDADNGRGTLSTDITTPETSDIVEPDDSRPPEFPEIRSTNITADAELAEKTYQEAIEEVDRNMRDAENNGIVLGVEQYKLIYLHVVSVDDRQLPESALGVDVTVVPGNMIYVPKDNQRTLSEHIHDS